MSYNSKAFLADRERLLEPDSIIIKGNRKWHQPVINVYQVAKNQQYEQLSEAEDNARQDEYLKKHGV